MLLASTLVEGWINRDKPGNDKTVDFDLKLAPMGTSPAMTAVGDLSISPNDKHALNCPHEHATQIHV